MSVERRVAAVSSHLRVPVDSCHPLRSTAAASTGTFAAKIGGSVAPGWEPVRTAFAENFAQRDELGASCCVTYKGEVVVDLWGGVKDPADGSLWEDDTIVNVFSSTKGIIALGVNMLIDRGFISIDEPVTKYWPEFEAEGKGLLTVGQLLSHQAGLMAVPPAPDPGTGESASGGFGIMLGEDGWMNTVNALAAATPKWSPTDSLFEYHGMTFGHLAGELVRRVSGKPLVEFLRENIFEPLGVEDDVLIGMDESDFPRVAVLAEQDGSTDKGTAGSFNRPETRKAVIPSANGHTNGRALARIYSAVANAPNSMISPDQIDLMRSTHSPPHSADNDESVAQGMRFGLGFRLSAAHDEALDYWFSPNASSFGHTGAGGASVGFADPETKLSFGYTANRFDQSASYDGSERRKHIIRAVYAVVEDIWED